jgi:hypothetical protein
VPARLRLERYHESALRPALLHAITNGGNWAAPPEQIAIEGRAALARLRDPADPT